MVINSNKKNSFLKNSLQLLCVRNVFDYEKKNTNSFNENKTSNLYVHHNAVPELLMKNEVKSQTNDIILTDAEKSALERFRNQGNVDGYTKKTKIPQSFSNPDYYGVSNDNRFNKTSRATPHLHDKNIIFEAKINTQKMSETNFKSDNSLSQESDTNLKLYRVKMRPKSNIDRRNQQNITTDRSKRSLSDTAVIAPTKKSVRFADSVGLELENVLNVYTNDRLTTSEQNLRNFNMHNSDFIHFKNDNPKITRKNVINVQIISVTENLNNNDNSTKRFLSSVQDCNQKQKLLRMNFCNNIRTRYNANGKLESEV